MKLLQEQNTRDGTPIFCQITSKTSPPCGARDSFKLCTLKTKLMVSLRFFQITSKKRHTRALRDSSTYFKNKIQGVIEILITFFKKHVKISRPHRSRDSEIISNYSKTKHKGWMSFSVITSKTKPSRFFKTSSRTKHKSFRDSFKLFQNGNTRCPQDPSNYFKNRTSDPDILSKYFKNNTQGASKPQITSKPKPPGGARDSFKLLQKQNIKSSRDCFKLLQKYGP